VRKVIGRLGSALVTTIGLVMAPLCHDPATVRTSRSACTRHTATP